MAAPESRLPSVGDPAPEFELPGTSGETVSLADKRGGRVLLAFFPAAFTGVCTDEFCDFSNGLNDFSAVGVTVYGISVDSIPTLREFKSKHGIEIELLSDFKRDVCRLYGTLLEDHFLSSRSYFLIDAEGILRWSHTTVNPGVKLDNDQLLAEIAKSG